MTSDDGQRADQSQRRDETPAERIDRNWGELLQEFRVAQTGIQVLFGFLLILPFQSGFTELDDRQRGLYLFIFACVAVATICILAPVMGHRLLFRHRLKGQLVVVANSLAKASLLFLGAAFAASVWLIVGYVSVETAAWAASGATALLILVLWIGLPLLLRDGQRVPDEADG